MALSFDLFYSMRSPYSYLLTPRIAALIASHAIDCRLRPVYPLAIRVPDFFERADPDWLRYLRRDTARVAERLGVPFGTPRPDPIVQDMQTRAIAAEQPHIVHLTRLAAAACVAGNGFGFAHRVSRIIFGGDIDGWNAGPHLADAVALAGLDLAELERMVATDTAALDALIETAEDEQRSVGHWGTPLMVFDGEPFFGQDRFDDLVWRMTQKGLTERSG